jgi:hypothetical protein
VLDFNLSFNTLHADYLASMFKQISKATNLVTLSMNLENTRLNQVHFSRAVKEFYCL